jgi:outer membrane protein
MRTTIRRCLPIVFLFASVSVSAAAVAGRPVVIDADESARLAVEASDRVTAADLRLEGARLRVDAADAARLPVLDVAAGVNQRSAVPELDAAIGGPGTPPVTIFPNIETTYSAGIALSQPLYSGGAISAGREAARHDLDAAGGSHRQTLMDIRFDARVAYGHAVAGEAALEAARAQERRARRLLEDARSLRAAGMAVDADVLGAEARAAAATVDVVRAATEHASALASLRSLLGLEDGSDLELADAGTMAVPAQPIRLDELMEIAEQQRPELLIADARIGNLLATERVVSAALKPAVGLAAEWDVARPNARYLPLEDAWNDSWSVGLRASWLLFDGQRTRSQAAAVRTERDALTSDRAELLRRVRLQVEQSRLELDAALEAVEAADASRVAAAAREASSRERYAAGLAQIYEMLEAQADLMDADVAVIRVRATAWIAAAALERAVGR